MDALQLVTVRAHYTDPKEKRQLVGWRSIVSLTTLASLVAVTGTYQPIVVFVERAGVTQSLGAFCFGQGRVIYTLSTKECFRTCDGRIDGWC
jgi:hypothetical protein